MVITAHVSRPLLLVAFEIFSSTNWWSCLLHNWIDRYGCSHNYWIRDMNTYLVFDLSILHYSFDSLVGWTKPHLPTLATQHLVFLSCITYQQLLSLLPTLATHCFYWLSIVATQKDLVNFTGNMSCSIFPSPSWQSGTWAIVGVNAGENYLGAHC